MKRLLGILPLIVCAAILSAAPSLPSQKASALSALLQTVPFYDEASMRVYAAVEDAIYRHLK